MGEPQVRTVGRNVLAIVMALACVGFVLLARGETSQEASSRLKIAATIFPLYDLVRQVAGPRIEVVLLVPPGASPHTFAVRPGTIQSLTGSAAIFAIGHGLDDWAARLAQDVDIARTIVVDTHIPLHAWAGTVHGQAAPSGHESHPGTADPHYWLAIPNAIRMVQAIAGVLGQLDPAAREGYEQRAAAYQQQLYDVDRDIRRLFAGLPQRDIATFHPAFGYFAAAYDLRIVATFEPSPGQEPTPRQVGAFLQLIKTRHIHVLFVEPQLPRAPLSSLARDLGVSLQELDPVGGVLGRNSYIALMRFNATQIATALHE
jgi:ABC-type Zn uptake system ZnuABC Zn-binding protein ZnuA